MLLYRNMIKRIFLIFISTIFITNANAKNLPEGYPECWQDTDNPVNINIRPLNKDEVNMGQSKDLFLPQSSKVGHKFILVDFIYCFVQTFLVFVHLKVTKQKNT